MIANLKIDKKITGYKIKENDFTEEICLTLRYEDGELDWHYFETEYEARQGLEYAKEKCNL